MISMVHSMLNDI